MYVFFGETHGDSLLEDLGGNYWREEVPSPGVPFDDDVDGVERADVSERREDVVRRFDDVARDVREGVAEPEARVGGRRHGLDGGDDDNAIFVP